MNHVERFRALMSFQPVDRLPRWEWATWWDKTIDRGHGEGLPARLTDTFEIHDYFGLDPIKQFWMPLHAPAFPPSRGHGIGWVANDDDYDALRPLLYPEFPELLESMRPWGERQARGDAVNWVTFDGFFWYPRTLFGIEPHMYAFYDHPDLMHRMNQDLADFGIPYEPTDELRHRRAISWKYQVEIVRATPKPKHWIAVRFEDFVLKQEETLTRLEGYLGFPLTRIPVRLDSVGRYRTDTERHTFPFFADDEFYDVSATVAAQPS